jgi:hypothetical protein
VVLAAGCPEEALKCLQSLVHQLYPLRSQQHGHSTSSSSSAAHQQQQRPQQPPADDPWSDPHDSQGHASSAAEGASDPPSSSHSHSTSTSSSSSAVRWTTEQEVAATYVLYFACVPPKPMLLQVVAVLSVLSAAALASRPLQLALQLVGALGRGDYVQVFRLQQACPRRMQLVLREAQRKVGAYPL